MKYEDEDPDLLNEADSLADIKREPDLAHEDDDFEDAGDLDLSLAFEAAYLTRIPKYLWRAWLLSNDDQDVRIGTVRVEGPLSKPKRMSLMLSKDMPVNNNVPKEYNLQTSAHAIPSTFVFTETDLPGYNTRHKQSQDSGKGRNSKVEKPRRSQPYYRKTVPKRTAFTGRIEKDLNCLPVENSEYHRIIEARIKEENGPRRETQILRGAASTLGGNVLNPGTLGKVDDQFKQFIKPTGPQKPRGQDNKAARMPQNELLDRIHDCFKEFKYWPLKSLKARLNQPEAYLRQTLEIVAHLVRQGPHANTWQLKQDSLGGAYVKDDQAPAAFGLDGASDIGEQGESDDGDEDDDENVKMEDVAL